MAFLLGGCGWMIVGVEIVVLWVLGVRRKWMPRDGEVLSEENGLTRCVKRTQKYGVLTSDLCASTIFVSVLKTSSGTFTVYNSLLYQISNPTPIYKVIQP